METEEHPPSRRVELLALAAILLLGGGLRALWLGHLLTWDEATNLLAVRSYVSGVLDPYTHWFHRHPPIYMWVLAALSPERPGFEVRAELASIGFGLASIALIHLLNRRLFGVRVGLLSAFLLAVLPVSVFYDLWVKRDVAVTTFALASLALVAGRRELLAGLALGLAGLAKLTVVLWAGPLAAAAGSAWLAGRDARRALAGGIVVAILVAGWWYIDAADAFGAYAPFAAGEEEGWTAPWTYHLLRVPRQIGWLPLVLSVAGVAALLAAPRRLLAEPLRSWPLLLLVGGHVALMIPVAKTPWMVATLTPGWAALGALGLDAAARRIGARGARVAVIVLVSVGSLVPTVRTDYDRILHDDHPGHFEGAWRSRELGRALNARVGEGELVAVAGQGSWRGLEDSLFVDPVLAHTLEPMALLVRRSTDPPQRFVDDARGLGVRWILYVADPERVAELTELADAIPGASTELVTGALIVDLTAVPESEVPRRSYAPGLYR